MSTLQRIALVFTVIGAVNWGLIGFFQFDLVAAIFGGQNSGSFTYYLRHRRYFWAYQSWFTL